MLMYVNINYYYLNVFIFFSSPRCNINKLLYCLESVCFDSLYKRNKWLVFLNKNWWSLIGIFAVGNDMVLKHYTRCIYLILFTLCGYEMQLHSDCASDAINWASLFAKMSTKWPIHSGKRTVSSTQPKLHQYNFIKKRKTVCGLSIERY